MQKYSKTIKALIFIICAGIIFYLAKGKSFPSSYHIKNISAELTFNPPMNYTGATLVNLDDDEENEIFISAIMDKNTFYKFRDGKFQTISIPELEDADRKTFAVTACDLNDDGRDELLIINSGEHESRIMAYKAGKWTEIFLSEEITRNLSHSYSAACIDRTGKGHYGLAVASENGPIQYLEIQNGQVVDIASSIGLGKSAEGRGISGVPGAQGFTNIFVGNKSGANLYFVNKKDGTFEEKAEQLGLSEKEYETRGIGLIDLNHDELIDVTYGNHLGPLRILEQQRDGSFKDVAPDMLAKSYEVNATVVGDFNFDGYEDIYMNNIRNRNELFASYAGDWFHIDLGENSEKDLFGVSSIAADLNHDGKFEILNTHGDGEKFPLTMYTIEPVGNFISFKIKLQNKGIPRGALLKLTTSKRDLVKAVNSGSGRFANYDDVLMFGLLKDENVQTAEILLPSGQKVIKNEAFKINAQNLIQL